jgi:hypothetical protein
MLKKDREILPQCCKRRGVSRHPAPVMERGSGDFFFLEIHVAGVMAFSASAPTRQTREEPQAPCRVESLTSQLACEFISLALGPVLKIRQAILIS